MTHLPRILLLSLVFLCASAALADSAEINFVPQFVQHPDRIEALFAMVNNGPDVARKTVLTFEVPEGVTVSRLIFGGQCDTTQRPIRCDAGDLHVGAPIHYGGITITTPIANGTYTLTMSVSSETPDPNARNNAGTFTWETKIEADLTFLVVPRTDRVDPGGTGDFLANICNEVRDNRPPAVRADFTVANGSFVSMTPASGFTCTVEGSTAVCTRAELEYGCPQDPFKFSIRASDDRRGGEARVTAVVTGDVAERNPANNQDSKAIPVYRWIKVDTTADDGPGSLRDAITQANAGCTPGPCRIVFEIPEPVPAEGWFTITPSRPLPSITAERVTLEGSRQTKFTGNTNGRGPEIAIDGHLAHRGIRMLALCEGVVDGLAIGNFDEDQGLWISTGAACGHRPDRREVLDNHIGVDPGGNVPWPNLRGLRADFAEGLNVSRNVISNNRYSGIWMWRGAPTITKNLIEDNGASGILLGPEVFSASVNDNVIRRNADMGLAVAFGPRFMQIRRNAMKDNGGLGIDWGLDGVSPVDADDHQRPSNAPVIHSASYDPATDKTSITLSVKSTPLGSSFNLGTFDIFANETPDGDGEKLIGTGFATPRDVTATIDVSGNHRGKWVNATWTREHQSGLGSPRDPKTESHSPGYAIITSELSNSVLVQ